MDDFIISILTALTGGDSSAIGWLAGNALGAAPLSSLSEYSPVLHDAAVQIHAWVVRPVAMVVLSIVVMLAFAEQSSRIDGDKALGAKVISGLLLKVSLVVVAVESAPLILNAIAQTAEWIGNSAYATQLGGLSVRELPEGVAQGVRDADLVNKLVMIVVLLIPWLLTVAAGIVSIVLLFLRYLQLYILFAFASLPVTFLGYENTRSIGIGFLKRFATISFSGVVIVVVIKLYQALASSGDMWGTAEYNQSGDILGWIFANFGAFIIGPLVLVFMLLQANNLAKAIVGE